MRKWQTQTISPLTPLSKEHHTALSTFPGMVGVTGFEPATPTSRKVLDPV